MSSIHPLARRGGVRRISGRISGRISEETCGVLKVLLENVTPRGRLSQPWTLSIPSNVKAEYFWDLEAKKPPFPPPCKSDEV